MKQDQQREMALQVREYLHKNISRHVTIDQLATRFLTSPTQLKRAFRGEVGMPVYAYAKAQKMKAAARLLRETNWTVLEIAGSVGYSNGSKFARAFRDVMGRAPSQYRREMRN